MTNFAQGPEKGRDEYGVRSSKQYFITSEDKAELLKELTNKAEGDEKVQTQGKIPDLPKGPRQLNRAQRQSSSQ